MPILSPATYAPRLPFYRARATKQNSTAVKYGHNIYPRGRRDVSERERKSRRNPLKTASNKYEGGINSVAHFMRDIKDAGL